MAPPGEEQGVLAGPAAGIEDITGHPDGRLDELRPRLADVPRGALPA
jgi:hypothetical protein